MAAKSSETYSVAIYDDIGEALWSTRGESRMAYRLLATMPQGVRLIVKNLSEPSESDSSVALDEREMWHEYLQPKSPYGFPIYKILCALH